MPTFTVELHGVAREVYTVQAATAEEAAANWMMTGRLHLAEASDMDVVSITEET